LIFLVAARVSVTLLDARFTQFVVISLRRNRKAPSRPAVFADHRHAHLLLGCDWHNRWKAGDSGASAASVAVVQFCLKC
jgi:hypothetical protein